MTVFVQRRNGVVIGVFAKLQPGIAEEEVAADAPDVVAFLAPPAPTYRQLRAAAYRDELGKEQGDFVKTIGDVLDALIRAHYGDTTDLDAIKAKIDTIKAQFPQPA